MYAQSYSQAQGLWPASHLPAAHHSLHHSSTAGSIPRGYSTKPKGPPTPPEDMSSSLATSSQATTQAMNSRYQEQGSYYTDRYAGSRSRGSFRDSTYDHRDNHRSTAVQQPTRSQAVTSRQPSPSTAHQSHASNASQHRKTDVQMGSIAPALQIPRTINNSQGSLSELAAQITCLFWFESSAVLDFAEDPASTGMIPRALYPETIPTTGFRKWVTTILSTTQVAQNVILLALLFIYRLKKQNPSVKGKLGSEYRLLTVALMLGNKFLDDNTYTNKTWAEVSGISVMEVHIMEVEFLSNMKYNLFTSAEQWNSWQIKLGRFARFIERATQTPSQLPASLAALADSCGPAELPSPPMSFHASPPRSYGGATPITHPFPQLAQDAEPQVARSQPLNPILNAAGRSRKRSLEQDDDVSTAAKRVMYSQPHFMHSQTSTPTNSHNQDYSTLAPVGRSSVSRNPSTTSLPQAIHGSRGDSAVGSAQLPPISQQLKSVAGWQNTPMSSATAPMAFPSSMAMALQSARSSRAQSPYPSSTNVSPTNTSLLPTTAMYGQPGQSPSFFLEHRDSPYRPVRQVHTLLVPPPSRALHQRDQTSDYQMHYQPLGRPVNERLEGRLPYIAQNQWFDGTYPRNSTGSEQWPNSLSYPDPRYSLAQRPHGQ